jgi:hypothetical protein
MSGFNIAPKSTFEGVSSSGEKFFMEEFDNKTYWNMQMAKLVQLMIVGGFLAVISAPIILLIAFITFDGHSKFWYIASGIISGFFLIDCSNGWLLSAITNLMFDPSTLDFFIRLNFAAFILSIIFLLFSNNILKLINDTHKELTVRITLFVTMILLITSISYKIGKNNFEDNFVNKVDAELRAIEGGYTRITKMSDSFILSIVNNEAALKKYTYEEGLEIQRREGVINHDLYNK